MIKHKYNLYSKINDFILQYYKDKILFLKEMIPLLGKEKTYEKMNFIKHKTFYKELTIIDNLENNEYWKDIIKKGNIDELLLYEELYELHYLLNYL